MRILIISTFFPPQNSIASHRPYSWAKYWSKAGHDVVVLTTPKNKLSAEPIIASQTGFHVVERGYGSLMDWIINSYKTKQSTVVKAKPTNQGHIKKALNRIFKKIDDFRISRGIFHYRRFPDFSSYWAKNAIKWAISQEPWDIVISTYGPHTTHAVGYAIRTRNHAGYWIADFRDLWTDDHIFKGMALFRGYEKWLERRYLSRADLITTVSEPLAQLLSAKSGKQCLTVENGFEPADAVDLPQKNVFADRPNKVRIVYTGSIYRATRDPSPLFEAIRLINDSETQSNLLANLEVVFVGGNIEILNEMVSKYHVDPWVRLEGFVSRQTALMMQRDAHVLLFLESNANGVDGILTGKIFEYLSSGTPVWAIGNTIDSTPGQLVINSRGGAVFGNDSSKIKEALISLLQNFVKAQPQLNAEVLQRYTRERLAMKLLNEALSDIREKKRQ